MFYLKKKYKMHHNNYSYGMIKQVINNNYNFKMLHREEKEAINSNNNN